MDLISGMGHACTLSAIGGNLVRLGATFVLQLPCRTVPVCSSRPLRRTAPSRPRPPPTHAGGGGARLQVTHAHPGATPPLQRSPVPRVCSYGHTQPKEGRNSSSTLKVAPVHLPSYRCQTTHSRLSVPVEHAAQTHASLPSVPPALWVAAPARSPAAPSNVTNPRSCPGPPRPPASPLRWPAATSAAAP